MGVQGIEAEIPQDLHEQIRGIGAESPVFGAKAPKMHPNSEIEVNCKDSEQALR
jgi:hypothetical protein